MKEWTYAERMALLREKKIRHTLEKRQQQGFTDADDYGTIPVPADFSFTPVTDERGGIFGAELCAENFKRLVEAHPIPWKFCAGAGARCLPNIAWSTAFGMRNAIPTTI